MTSMEHRDPRDPWQAHLTELREHLAEWRTRLAEWRKQVQGTAPDNQIVDSAADVDTVRRMIHSALKKAGLAGKDTQFTCTASLTLKVLKGTDGRGGVKFSVCGVKGGAGVARNSKDTQTLTITFTPTEAAVDTSGIDDQNVNEFKSAFDGLAKVVASPDVFGTSKAVIDINFMLDNAMKMSIIAGGAIKDESTHHLSVTLSRRDTKDS